MCMKDRACTRNCPKAFLHLTEQGSDSYPRYRRSPDDGGHTGIRRAGRSARQGVTNVWFVPYNPYLSRPFNCHLNVEITVASRVLNTSKFQKSGKFHDTQSKNKFKKSTNRYKYMLQLSRVIRLVSRVIQTVVNDYNKKVTDDEYATKRLCNTELQKPALLTLNLPPISACSPAAVRRRRQQTNNRVNTTNRDHIYVSAVNWGYIIIRPSVF